MGSLGRVCLVALTVGCGYRSAYVPPADGRARAVWQGNRLVTVGETRMSRCEDGQIVHRMAPRALGTAPSLWLVGPRGGFDDVDDVDDDGDDDDDDDSAAAAIVITVVALTAIATTAVALAAAPAGRPRDSAATLHELAMLEDAWWRATSSCTAEEGA